MTLALYGVVRADHPLPPGASMRLIARDGLAVVATAPPIDAAAHLAAVSGLVLDGPVLPLRFGTIAVDEDAVHAEVLAPSAAHLAGELDRLDGLAEVHIRLRFDENRALTAVYDECRDRLAAMAGHRLDQARFIVRRLEAWRQAQVADLLAGIFQLARDQTCLQTVEHTEERWAFLIELSAVAAVRAEIDELAGNAEADVEWAGPLPAYSFLAVDVPRDPWTPAARWGW